TPTTRRFPRAASAPKLGRVEPAPPAAPVPDCVHHVDACRPPSPFHRQTKSTLSAPKRSAEATHPTVVALVSVLPLPDRAGLVGSDMKQGGRLGGEVSGAPIAGGEIDRLFEKGRLVERNVDLETRATGERRLGEQKIAATDRKVRGADPEV